MSVPLQGSEPTLLSLRSNIENAQDDALTIDRYLPKIDTKEGMMRDGHVGKQH